MPDETFNHKMSYRVKSTIPVVRFSSPAAKASFKFHQSPADYIYDPCAINPYLCVPRTYTENIPTWKT